MKSLSPERPGAIPGIKDLWLLGAVFMLAMIAYREILLWNFTSHSLPNYAGWFFNLSDTSPQFLYLLAAGLIYFRRHDTIIAFNGNPAPWSALLFLVPGVLLYVWGRYIGASDVVYLSFLLVLFGSILLHSGFGLARQLSIPLLILLLAMPLPAVLINKIVFPFQLWTADHSVWLLDIFGISSYQEGDMISLIGGKKVRAAESCTALGFMKWLLIIALAYVYLFPVSRVHAFILVLSAPFIAYAVNLLRAFSLILNPGKDVLSIHLAQGIVFFMIGFVFLYALDSFLLRLGAQRQVQGELQALTEGAEGKRSSLFVLIAFYTVLVLISITLPRWNGMPMTPGKGINIDENMGDWKLDGTLNENRLFLGSVRYSSMLSRFYVRDNEQVAVFIGYDDRLRRNQSLYSEKNAFQGEMGLVEEQYQVELKGVGKPVQAVIATNSQHGRLLSYHWYEGTGGLGEEILRALFALDQSPLRRPGGAMVIRLSTDVAPTVQGRKIADQRLRDFLAAMRQQR